MTAQAPSSAPVWHTLSVQDALKAQGVDEAVGLSAAEVEKRRAQYGPNKFAEAKKESAWSKWVRQYQDPMQIVLLIAAPEKWGLRLFSANGFTMLTGMAAGL